MNRGNKLRFAIQVSEKTQNDVAEFLGVTKSTLSQRLDKAKFSTEEMEKICRFIGCEYIEKIRLQDGTEI